MQCLYQNIQEILNVWCSQHSEMDLVFCKGHTGSSYGEDF